MLPKKCNILVIPNSYRVISQHNIESKIVNQNIHIFDKHISAYLYPHFVDVFISVNI